MELEKVVDALKDSEKRKFWGTIEVEFKGGIPSSVAKTQKILFDPYQPRVAQGGAAVGKSAEFGVGGIE